MSKDILQELLLSFHHVGPWDWTQVDRPSSYCLSSWPTPPALLFCNWAPAHLSKLSPRNCPQSIFTMGLASFSRSHPYLLPLLSTLNPSPFALWLQVVSFSPTGISVVSILRIRLVPFLKPMMYYEIEYFLFLDCKSILTQRDKIAWAESIQSKYFISYSFATVVVLSELYQRQWRRCASGQNTLDVGSVILLMHSGFLSYQGWSYRKQVKYSCTLLCYNRRHQRNAIPRAKDSCCLRVHSVVSFYYSSAVFV